MIVRLFFQTADQTIIQKHSHHQWFVHKTPIHKISNAGCSKLDGSNFMTAPLNMDENRIENMLDPQNEQDSVNKGYLETELVDYLKRNGTETSTTFRLDMANYRIKNVGNPQNQTDSINKTSILILN